MGSIRSTASESVRYDETPQCSGLEDWRSIGVRLGDLCSRTAAPVVEYKDVRYGRT
jgi:hypothetical protein